MGTIKGTRTMDIQTRFNTKLTNTCWALGVGLLLLIASWTAAAVTIEKSPNDARTYQYLALENGIKAIVVQDPKAIKSACSLEINVGSFDEPDNFLGLAHLLEHMLFLGTEKFPKADEYHQMIEHNGGMHNAFTAGDRTHYFFNVQTAAFPTVLERFAEFFKTPLLTKDLIDREKHNVDSEFQMYLNQDNWRSLDVNKETASPKHPFSRFTVGNLTSLDQDKDTLHQAVTQFYQQYYSADRMTVVLVGSQPVEQLATWVKAYFSDIQKKTTPPVIAKPFYEPAQLNQSIYVTAKGNTRKLSLSFAFPSFAKYDREQPLHFLSQLLGYEGEGSLYAILKQKGWITGLASGADENPNAQDILQLDFALTPEGFSQIDAITAMTFEKIALVKKQGFPEVFFNDIKQIHHLAFTYQEREPEAALAQDLAHRLHWHQPERVITSRYIMHDLSYAQAIKPIQAALGYLDQAHLRRVVLSPDIKAQKQTQWFKTAYDIKPLTVNTVKTAPKKSKLTLPEKNPFMPGSLALKPVDSTQSIDLPARILDQPGVKLWHLQDAVFKEPKASITVNLVNPISQASPKHQITAELLAQLVMEQLKLTLYPAIMLGEEIGFYDHPRGLTIQLFGYSDKQDQLLQVLLKQIKSYQVDPAEFVIIKERHVRMLKNFDQLPPFRQAAQGIVPLFVKPNWHIEELQAVIEQVTVDDIQQLKDALLRNLGVEILITGNYTKAEALKFSDVVLAQLPVNTQANTVLPPAIYRLPDQDLRFKTLNTTDPNNAFVLYVQNDDASIPAMAKTYILSKILMAPMYHTMRTEKQIGYALGVTPNFQQRVAGLMFYVQSPNYNPVQIYQALQDFWQGYADEIKALTPAQMQPIQQALINELRDPAKTLREQTARLWPTIEIGRYEFDIREKLAQAVERTTAKDIQQYYQHLMLDAKTGKVAVISKVQDLPKTWVALDNWQALKNDGQVFKF